jgi:hypothetical protein
MSVKTNLLVLLFLLIFACRTNQRKQIYNVETETSYRGMVLISPSLNSTYFFPFRGTIYHLNPSDFLINKYDTGFMISWKDQMIRNKLVDQIDFQLDQESVFKAFAFVEFSKLHSLDKSDSIYTFRLVHNEMEQQFVYYDRVYVFSKVENLTQ